MRRVLVVGASLLSGGALVMMASFLVHAREWIRSATAGLGLVCTIAGAVQTAIGMPRILLEDAYLAIRSDGLQLRLSGVDSFVSWDDLERVRHEPGAVVLVLREGEPVVIRRVFAGITLEDLAKRLDDARRKAQFNLL
jgi:hypothetical protein